MARCSPWQRPDNRVTRIANRSAIAAVGAPGTVSIVDLGDTLVALQGHPQWRSTSQEKTIDAVCRRVAESYAERGADVLQAMSGDFALVIIDEQAARALLAIDRIGVRNIVYQQIGAGLVFGPTSDVVRGHPQALATIEPQALYDYVYFHMVPAPETAYREHARLAPAHYLLYENARLTTRRYWAPRFVEDRRGSVADFKPAFRAALRTAVDALADGERCATFLSGGTDSSTVAGLLRAAADAPIGTYSIGFDAAGYDEMEYARTVARHFATSHHEYYVTPEDVVRAVPLLAAAYDQPFGNASAVPTYYCARHARADGIERMLGGDGGDELFGGNDRYAKHYQLALYERLPRAARALLEAILFTVPGFDRVPPLRRMKSYVEQARLPMPARYESYNLLERLRPEKVFDADFLATVDRHRPLARLTEAYEQAQASSIINRMLALDLEFTLADNDLPKVTRMCEIAGVDVAFPMLHEQVVDFSFTLPPDFKLRRTRLRYFFKEALRDFLPEATIAKKKHGFGLPVGLWLRDDAKLRELGTDALASLRRRGIFRDELLTDLMSKRLGEHAPYYGTLAWVLMMLEMWFRARSDTSLTYSVPGSAVPESSIGD
jgi:asparagine synthase (glutamine-hydrolysing)